MRKPGGRVEHILRVCASDKYPRLTHSYKLKASWNTDIKLIDTGRMNTDNDPLQGYPPWGGVDRPQSYREGLWRSAVPSCPDPLSWGTLRRRLESQAGHTSHGISSTRFFPHPRRDAGHHTQLHTRHRASRFTFAELEDVE